MTTEIPADLVRLLEEPNYGHLGTIRPDDTVQVNPMWFLYDGETLRFTHTTKRAKFRNLQHNPSMSLSVIDPENPFHYLEVRGRLIEVEPDPEGAFYVVLGKRYGNPSQTPPPDKADRVVLVMSIEHTTTQ
ncbi:PPOX class F420-dependent enzyme [Cnuibacter physcomitrellae]|uniref:PPOX class F420-dependent enzyme n=1 Tax=Cnuibacter physcomitrellae TaxID=1619308 RepID=A0A1X9LFP4_9MICO|nr:PPOX class F420-dependent oxidoreductase [Cnuibacter physcomitrellae]ARJ04026.1 PPOX class F420-dependent enzyme [Cnuibacter physcomitrellae]GGI40063.1 PPOX class F420-dependent enzyme [Cnuibacter physcomitrellae]